VQFPCARCARSYEIADELVMGRAVKVACPACGNLAVHRVPAPEAAPPRPPVERHPEEPSALAEADDDDFENAWASVEAPAGAEASWPAPKPPEHLQELPPEPDQPVPYVPATPPPPAPPQARASAKPAAVPKPSVPPPAVSLEEEEPVMVTAELVLRRSNRRSRITAAVVALAAVAAVGGGGYMALRWKRDTAGPGEAGRKGSAAASSDGPAGALSAGDLAKLMGKKAPGPVEAPSAPLAAAAPAADRPKHEKLTGKDKGLLDLLAKKGDAAVTVQDEDHLALSTSRGSLDEQAIEGTLSRNGASFSACVSRAVAADPEKKLSVKRVSLELTVRPSGRVQKAAVGEKDVARTPLGQCIVQAAKRMVFPGFDGEAIDIVVPLKLKVTY
jgi:hypothetical protein